jgi:hypothetical protein
VTYPPHRGRAVASPRWLAGVLAGVVLGAVACQSGPVEHADGSGPLESRPGAQIGQLTSFASGVTRTLGGVPLCSADGRAHRIEDVTIASIEGAVDIDFVGLRTTRYRQADEPDEAPETMAPSAEGTLERQEFVAPRGFEVALSCSAGPDVVEIAVEYTPLDDAGAVLDGVRVDYRDADGTARTFRVDTIVVGCGTADDPPSYADDCADAGR